MLKKNNQILEFQDLLDSDDELPTNYNEEPDLPAYLDDERFDPIHFNWIKNNKGRSIPVISATAPAPVKAATTPAPVKAATTPAPVETAPTTATQSCSHRNLIKKGILNEQDIMCMKSVAARSTDDSALLWFIDFLMYKDMQADYKFLKSCLVINQENYGSLRNPYSKIFCPQSLSKCFEFIVK